jgi:hypothetical protein
MKTVYCQPTFVWCSDFAVVDLNFAVESSFAVDLNFVNGLVSVLKLVYDYGLLSDFGFGSVEHYASILGWPLDCSKVSYPDFPKN